MTPAEAVAACKSLKAQLESGRAELNACRRAARFIRKRAVADFTRTGVGRSVFGVKASRGKTKGREKSLRVVIPGPRVVREATGFLVTSKLQGIAALVEKGGQTKPHQITGSRGQVGGSFFYQGPTLKGRRRTRIISGRLGFMGNAGHVITPARVSHPGSRFAKDDFYARAWNAGVPVFQTELEKGLEELAQKFQSRY